jgi:gas vesicle protein
MNNKDNTLGFIVGFGCGVGIALLLAPKSGGETRSVIANKARKATDRLKHQVAGLRDSATELLEKDRNEVEHHKEGLQHAVDAGKRAHHESLA